jgi:hypothetical protein
VVESAIDQWTLFLTLFFLFFCFFVFFVPCALFWLQAYRRVNREVKRMDSTSRSPLFSHFSETLTGLPTIRAYGQQHPFIYTNADRMDNNNRFYFLVAASQRWLGTRMEMLGGLIIFATGVIATLSASSIPSGLVGLSLSYAMQVTQQMSLFLRQSVETENYMNSVERARFYTNGIAHEAASTVPDADSAPEVSGSSWPCSGKIEFEGASMRYREGLKLVMDRVSFSIAGGERVGIVGRTGAGQRMGRLGTGLHVASACLGDFFRVCHDLSHCSPFLLLRLSTLSRTCSCTCTCRQVLADGLFVPSGGALRGENPPRRRGYFQPGTRQAPKEHGHHPAGPDPLLRNPAHQPGPLRGVQRRPDLGGVGKIAPGRPRAQDGRPIGRGGLRRGREL